MRLRELFRKYGKDFLLSKTKIEWEIVRPFGVLAYEVEMITEEAIKHRRIREGETWKTSMAAFLGHNLVTKVYVRKGLLSTKLVILMLPEG